MTPQGPTLAELQGYLASLNKALGDPTLTVRYPDGRQITFRTVQEIRLAKSDIEDQIRTYGGKNPSKSVLAQHKRGDGPFGPGPGNPGGWGYW